VLYKSLTYLLFSYSHIRVRAYTHPRVTQPFYGCFRCLAWFAIGPQRFTRKPLKIALAIFTILFVKLNNIVTACSSLLYFFCKCQYDFSKVQCTANNCRFCWCD